MADERIILRLNRSDIGQMIDGLIVRRDNWRETQRYLEGEEVDCLIEECSNPEEACAIADSYDRIVKEISCQMSSMPKEL